MNVAFKHKDYPGTCLKTEHKGLPDDTTWYELVNLYMDHLNGCGYFIDNEMKDTVFSAIDNLMFERNLHMMYPSDNE